ncbi:MAG TPA: J domain-containing protein [Solirubrobacteraceae bacterium]|nr:J domain-containing protein [Solirubrobacteraceae bacterium]
MRDPHEVLGVEPDANEGQIAAAYRRMAKRLHPDVAGADPKAELRMAELNGAYDLLRAALAGNLPDATGSTPEPPPASKARPAPLAGHWLQEPVRKRLGPELLEVLDEREPVRLVSSAATGSSPTAVVVLTDRRLLWLSEDNVLGRVRALRLRDLVEAAVRESWPRRGRVKLRLRSRDGRRHTFAELDPAHAGEIARAIQTAARSRMGWAQ